jgi:hypothetical protein
VHITYFIYHNAAKYSVAQLTERLTAALDQLHPNGGHWYVHAVLLPFFQANYANKYRRHAKNDKLAEDSSLEPELARLNDPRAMREEEVDGNLKYVLGYLHL